jgi:hypothetical protein
VDARQTKGFLALVAVLTAAGCMISQDEFAGRECTFDAECPEAYTCAGPPEGLRFCEVIYPPRSNSSADAGPVDAGPVPTYCKEVQPILAANCISSCHGADNSGSGQTDFRLDYYEPGAGQPKGAKAQADRIKSRAFDRQDMPPLGNPAPSAAQRAVLGRWVVAGAPFCTDGGTP